MAEMMQATSRVHRLGALVEQVIHVLTTDGTFDVPHLSKIMAKYMPEVVGSIERAEHPQLTSVETTDPHIIASSAPSLKMLTVLNLVDG